MDEGLLTPEERRQIPKGFHYLLEYKEELDWLLNLQLAKAEPLIRKDERERIQDAYEGEWRPIADLYCPEWVVKFRDALYGQALKGESNG